MKRHRPWNRLLAMLLTVFAAGLVQADDQPLPTHPELITGSLDNGFRYVIKEHPTPPDRVVLFLQVNAGSLYESDQQRGLAHFLEHMAFNGSENFPPGELIPFFERLGLQFGRHQNAFTSFDRTAYLLDLPKNDPETVNSGLLWLSDMAWRLLLLEEEIDRERGVILEEARTGKGADQRMMEELWPKLMPGSILPQRFPIGDEEIIASAPRDQFLDFYQTWYRPDRMTLYVVGDVDADQVKPEIEKLFAAGQAAAPDRRDPQADVTHYTEQMAAVVTDPEFVGANVEMLYLGPPSDPTDTVSEFRRNQVEEMANWILNRRLAKLVAAGDAPFRSANVAVFRLFGFADAAYAEATTEPGEWRSTLSVLAREVKRAYEHGFLEQELADARRQALAHAERAVLQEDSMPAMFVAQMLAGAEREGDTVMSAEQRLTLLKEILPLITVADLNAAFAERFDPSRMAFVISLPESESVDVPDEETVLALAREALSRPVEPYLLEERPEELMAELPDPAEIVEQSFDEELAVTSAWLSNNARVHYKFNDLRKNQVTVQIGVGGGRIEETAENRGITELAVAGLNQSATSTLSSHVIRDLMTGKNVGVSAMDDRDAILLNVSGTPQDLEAGLQLAHLLLTDAIIEPSAYDNWREATLESIEGERHDPVAQFRKVLWESFTEDPRVQALAAENVEALTREAAQEWVRRIFAEGPIEVTIVGDIPAEEVLPLVQRYVGSLPARDRSSSRLESLRAMAAKDGPVERHETYEAQEPVAFGFAGFRSADAWSVDDRRLLDVASQILSTRMNKRIREEKQLVYSIGAFQSASEAYPDMGIFGAGSYTAPNNAPVLAEEVDAMIEEFAKEGPTPEEIEVAVGQILSQLETDTKEPVYWLGNLSLIDYRGRTLDELRSEREFFESGVSPDAVRQAFAKYATPARRVKFDIVPKAGSVEAAQEAQAEAEATAGGEDDEEDAEQDNGGR